MTQWVQMGTCRKSTRPGQQSWRTCKGGQKTDGRFSFLRVWETNCLRSKGFEERLPACKNSKFFSHLFLSYAALFTWLSLLPFWSHFPWKTIKLIVSQPAPNPCECWNIGLPSELSLQMALAMSYPTPWFPLEYIFSLCVWNTAHSGPMAFCFQSHNTDLNLITWFLCEIFQLFCLSPL